MMPPFIAADSMTDSNRAAPIDRAASTSAANSGCSAQVRSRLAAPIPAAPHAARGERPRISASSSRRAGPDGASASKPRATLCASAASPAQAASASSAPAAISSALGGSIAPSTSRS
jgi:hypothetical protein